MTPTRHDTTPEGRQTSAQRPIAADVDAPVAFATRVLGAAATWRASAPSIAAMIATALGDRRFPAQARRDRRAPVAGARHVDVADAEAEARCGARSNAAPARSKRRWTGRPATAAAASGIDGTRRRESRVAIPPLPDHGPAGRCADPGVRSA